MVTYRMDSGKTGSQEIVVGVIGQPNVGKSTLFNLLTGRKVHVANWPGVTVEKHEGWREHHGYRLHFIDLPGIYGFSASTLEEVIARNFIVSGEADVLIVLIDSTAPERTMYLAIQALELFPRTIVVFTKSDLTHAHGIHINYEALANRLGVPVVSVSAVTETGIDRLLDLIIEVARGRIGRGKPLKIGYGELEPFISEVEEIAKRSSLSEDYPLRWLAVRLLEGDQELIRRLEKRGEKDIVKEVMRLRNEVINVFKRRPEEIMAQRRFEYLSKIVEGIVVRVEVKPGVYEWIDKVFAHPVIGSITSILLLVSLFIVVFTLNTGFPFNIILENLGYSGAAEYLEEYSLGGLMEKLIVLASGLVEGAVAGYPQWLQSLILDGVIGGVGAVLVFLPLIFLVALMLAILEDSGLSPRIAVSLHNLLSKIGISGHAVFPITLSLGCNVPAIMATRATPSYRERLRLITTLAFIPCQARLVVILAFASALRGLGSIAVIALSYLGAFLTFMLVNKALYIYDRKKGYAEEPELLLELPPIHKPIPKVIWWLTWDSVKHFLKKAGTIIFLVTLVAWALLYFSPSLSPAKELSESIGAGIAKLFAPLLIPLNMNDTQAWMMAYALIVGFLAKEAVVGTLALLAGTNTATDAIKTLGYSDPQIAALTMFIVLYVPCAATLAVVYSESRSFKTTLLTIALMLSIAYMVMIATYVIASLFI